MSVAYTTIIAKNAVATTPRIIKTFFIGKPLLSENNTIYNNI
jgi:hypothetical protein